MKRLLLYIAAFLLLTPAVLAQSEKKQIRQGNDFYQDGDFSEAEVAYRKALESKPGYYKGNFNLGDALYEQENYAESQKLFDEAANASADPKSQARAYYNLGNSLLKEKKFEESINAYKQTLRRNPADEDARYNLEYARQMLKQQQQQQQQQQQENKDQNQEQNKDQDQQQDQKQDQDKKDQEQQDKKDQQKQDQNKDQDKNQQDQQQDQKQGDPKDQQQQQQSQPQQISKQDAQRMLDALKNDEKGTLKKLQKEKAKAVSGKKSDIDW